MKIQLKDVQITMTIEEKQTLNIELRTLFDEVASIAELHGLSSHELLREKYPKINEFLNVMNVPDDLPF